MFKSTKIKNKDFPRDFHTFEVVRSKMEPKGTTIVIKCKTTFYTFPNSVDVNTTVFSREITKTEENQIASIMKTSTTIHHDPESFEQKSVIYDPINFCFKMDLDGSDNDPFN